MRALIVGLLSAQLAVLGFQNAFAQSAASKHTPRGYPYDSKTCRGGYNACLNHYLGVGWQSAAAGSYCSHACRDFPPARRSK
jgi:hypothetical protein